MLGTRKLRSALVPLAFCLFVLPGCGKSGATVKGTLVLPPGLKLNDSDGVRINLVPEAAQGPVYSAAFSVSDNSFVAHGPKRQGVPPGKYKVTVEFQAYPGSPDNERRSAVFATINGNYNAVTTKLSYEVTTESTQTITIDLAKGTVAKN